MNILELESRPLAELRLMASRDFDVQNANRMKKEALVLRLRQELPDERHASRRLPARALEPILQFAVLEVLEIEGRRVLHHAEIGSVQRFPERFGPAVVGEVERESAAVLFGEQPCDQPEVIGLSASDRRPTLIAASGDEFSVNPETFAILMHISG